MVATVMVRVGYLMVRRVRRGALQLVLELREQLRHLRDTRVQLAVHRVQLGELVLVRPPRARTRYRRVLPADIQSCIK